MDFLLSGFNKKQKNIITTKPKEAAINQEGYEIRKDNLDTKMSLLHEKLQWRH